MYLSWIMEKICQYCNHAGHGIQKCPVREEDAYKGKLARYREQEGKEENIKKSEARRRANKEIHMRSNQRSQRKP